MERDDHYKKFIHNGHKVNKFLIQKKIHLYDLT